MEINRIYLGTQVSKSPAKLQEIKNVMFLYTTTSRFKFKRLTNKFDAPVNSCRILFPKFLSLFFVIKDVQFEKLKD